MMRFLMLMACLATAVPLSAQPATLPSRQALIDATMARNGAAFNDLGLDTDGVAHWVDQMLTDEAQLAAQPDADVSARAHFETRLRLAETYYSLGFYSEFERHLTAIETVARPMGLAGVSRIGRVALWRANRLSSDSNLPANADALIAEVAAACAVGESFTADVNAIAAGLDSLGGIYAQRGNPVAAEAMLGASLRCYAAMGRDAADQIYLATLARLRIDMAKPDAAYSELLPGLLRVARSFDQMTADSFDVERGGAERIGDMTSWGGLFLDVAWRLHSGGFGAGAADLGYQPWSNDSFDIAQRIYDTPASAALRRRAARDFARYEGNEAALALIDEQARLLAQVRIARNADAVARAAHAPAHRRASDSTVLNALAPQFWNGQGERAGIGYAPPPRVFEIARELGRFADPMTARLVEPWRVDHLLQTGEAMLLIVPTERGTHIFAFARGQSPRWYHSTLNAAQIRDLAREIRFHVGVDVAPSVEEFARWGEQPFARDAAHRLYAELVAPATAHMDGINHLYIIAGGPLESLPFNLLVTAPPSGNGFDPDVLRTTPWLADRFAISRMPTVDAFLILKGEARIRRWDAAAGRAPQRRARFVGFADPMLAGNDVACGVDAIRGGALTRSMPTDFSSDGQLSDMVRRLPRLPCSAEEAGLVSAEVRVRNRSLHLRADNSETILQSSNLADATILLFATHAVMPSELPGLVEPALVLTPPGTTTNPLETAAWVDDGLLSGSEIGDLRISPDWLILSACNSGGGSQEGLGNQAGGLTPWFFAAGANRILATNWPLLDSVAARLTRSTIRLARREHLGGAAALQRAMIAVRNDRSRDGAGAISLAHPMVWAVFELVGDGAAPAGR